MNTHIKAFFNVIFFVVLYLVIQLLVSVLTYIIWLFASGSATNLSQAWAMRGSLASHPIATATAMIASLVVIVAVFAICKWTPLSPTYLRTRPWGVFFWTILLAFGTIIPSELFIESIGAGLPEQMEGLFRTLFSHPAGYVALAVLAPLAEEVVFRGAVLRTLLNLFKGHNHWIAIVISALIFGVIHGNLAQGIHAFAAGLLLGWLYYRTRSILPGMVFHWVNNSVAYVVWKLFPQMADSKLIDLFHNDHKTLALAVLFSFCIIVPSLLQLAMRMKKA